MIKKEKGVNLIKGVKTKILKVIPDERGRLQEILRNDDPLFSIFGQVYVSTTYPGVVKAWHQHQFQVDNIACVHGTIKLVLVNMIYASLSKNQILEYYIGIHNPMLIQVPAGIWHGWKCISQEEAIIVNVPTLAYNYENPDEVRLDPHGGVIPYDWGRRDK